MTILILGLLTYVIAWGGVALYYVDAKLDRVLKEVKRGREE